MTNGIHYQKSVFQQRISAESTPLWKLDFVSGWRGAIRRVTNALETVCKGYIDVMEAYGTGHD